MNFFISKKSVRRLTLPLIFLSSTNIDAKSPTVLSLLDLSLEELTNVTISTASKYEENLTDTPSTIIVITKQQIEERGYTNLLQVLEGLPNIDVQRYSSQNSGETIGIRGIAKNNGFIILQDGVRISSPTSEPLPINDNFPIHYAKQIEIMYGPASVMYGADALTGVINILSETAEEINGAEIKGVVGENNTYSTHVKVGNKINENISITAGGHYKKTDNPNLAKYYPQSFVLSDLITFSGTTVVKAQDRVGYRGEAQNSSAFIKLSIFKDLDIGVNYSSEKHRSDAGSLESFTDYGADAHISSEIGTIYANYKFNLNKELSGFLRANYAWYEMKPESRYANKYVDFTTTGGYKYAWGERKQIDGQLQYKLNQQHIISGGFSAESYYSIPKTVDLETPYDPRKTPDQQTAFYLGTNNTLPVKMQQVSHNNIGGYLQWNAAWDKTFSTNATARYDHNSEYKETFNPKLGLVFKPTEGLTTKLLYGTAFLAPPPHFSREHYGSFSGQSSDGTYLSDFLHIPNPNLKPETISTFEFNADYQAHKNLKYGINLYQNTLKGIIDSAPTQTLMSGYVPGGFISYTQYNDNIGKIVSYGGDIHFDSQHSFDDSIVKLWGSYSYLNGKLNLKGRDFSTDLPMVAYNKLKLGLTYIYQKKYTVTPTLSWISKTYNSQSETNNPPSLQTSPSYWRVDLYAKAKIMNDLSLFLNINNLFDKRYYNTGDFPASMVASPQNPRTISLGFNYQFR